MTSIPKSGQASAALRTDTVPYAGLASGVRKLRGLLLVCLLLELIRQQVSA
jgi:hypothetical protein